MKYPQRRDGALGLGARHERDTKPLPRSMLVYLHNSFRTEWQQGTQRQAR